MTPSRPPAEPRIEIRQERPDHPDALLLIDGSEREQAAIYPPELRFAFSPQELIDADVHFLVLRIDGRPAACGGMAPLDGYGELKRMYTAPEFRGRRLAARVIAALEDAARARGLPLMRLETGKDSPEALRLYPREGYRRIPPFGAYEENGSSIYMEKRLIEA